MKVLIRENESNLSLEVGDMVIKNGKRYLIIFDKVNKFPYLLLDVCTLKVSRRYKKLEDIEQDIGAEDEIIDKDDLELTIYRD